MDHCQSGNASMYISDIFRSVIFLEILENAAAEEILECLCHEVVHLYRQQKPHWLARQSGATQRPRTMYREALSWQQVTASSRWINPSLSQLLF